MASIPSLNRYTLGWDVGGAHLKVALLNPYGQLVLVRQVACTLWRGMVHLETAIEIVMKDILTVQNKMNAPQVLNQLQHFITMTGELVDLFEHRMQGVEAICRLMNKALIGEKWFYSMQASESLPTFISFDTDNPNWIAQNWPSLASANWHASARLLAKSVAHGLLIDIGSTTSDFTFINAHKVLTNATTDAARMQAHTLIYAGVVRTPVMALGQSITFNGIDTSVAAEHFATTADVYRLTTDLIEADDMAETADNAEKSLHASAKRLARMIGHDAYQQDLKTWQALAFTFKAMQLKRLLDVTIKHLNDANFLTLTEKPVLVGAGVGRFLIKEMADHLHLPYVEASDVLQAYFVKEAYLDSDSQDSEHAALHQATSACLPAVSVAILGREHALSTYSATF